MGKLNLNIIQERNRNGNTLIFSEYNYNSEKLLF